MLLLLLLLLDGDDHRTRLRARRAEACKLLAKGGAGSKDVPGAAAYTWLLADTLLAGDPEQREDPGVPADVLVRAVSKELADAVAPRWHAQVKTFARAGDEEPLPNAACAAEHLMLERTEAETVVRALRRMRGELREHKELADDVAYARLRLESGDAWVRARHAAFHEAAGTCARQLAGLVPASDYWWLSDLPRWGGTGPTDRERSDVIAPSLLGIWGRPPDSEEPAASDLDALALLLACHLQRATYGAVASLLERPAPSLMEGRPRSPLYSWIVSARDGRPSGYASGDAVDPRLSERSEIIDDRDALRAWIDAHTPWAVGSAP